MSGHRVYIGHLATDTAERDLKDLFKDFGKIRDVTIKNRFGFVEFDDRRDAEDAVREFHGTKFMGQRIVVELAMGRKRPDNGRGRDNSVSNRIIVRNLPSKATWQDLKDFMSKAGRVTFADILKNRDGEGVVEFARRDDMKYALDKLSGDKLLGHRLDLEEAGRRRRSSRDRNRSRSPRRSSRRRSPSQSRSRSRSRSRSASGSRGRSSRNDVDDEGNIADNAGSESPSRVKEEQTEVKRERSESVHSRSSMDSRD